MQKITPSLWFDRRAEEAARHYVSLFGSLYDGCRVVDVRRFGDAGPGEPGTVMLVAFELAGQRFTAVNGGEPRPFTEALSLSVTCATQGEVDRLWAALADGGEEGRCGWVRDRYGVSWQVVPRKLPELLGDPDPAKAARVMEAMLGMRRIDVGALLDAHAG